MKGQLENIFVYTFYRFKDLGNIKNIKKEFDIFLKKYTVKGTILLASEGINGSLSGDQKDLNIIIKFIKSKLNIRILDIKVNKTNFFPFNRMKVRLKKEIVSLGKGKIDVNKLKGNLISPKDWNKIISDKKTKIIDVRNNFEICIGRFANSLSPKTNSFREFPDSIKKMKINKKDRIAMYCTGGIRCEKASAFMKMQGYNNVVQLDGGIIKYLDYHNKKNMVSLWNGECFVFDGRVTVNKKLLKGKYLQCYGCRRPIKPSDTKSKLYKKGVNCPYCFKERTLLQKNKSLSRQRQIEINKKKGLKFP
tara:strand:+ start:28 stop:945 length:918 start_codon:yes stop_codon:yes gene_type:complete